MAQPNTDRTAPQGETQPGVQGADGRKANPAQPIENRDDISEKGGQIAQDREQSTGVGSGQA
jgi:hypothetical protein